MTALAILPKPEPRVAGNCERPLIRDCWVAYELEGRSILWGIDRFGKIVPLEYDFWRDLP